MPSRKIAFVLGVISLGLAASGMARETGEADEKLLQGLGLASDNKALLEFLRLRSFKDGDRKRLEELVRHLASDSFKLREQASRELIMRGPVALPFLKSAMKGSPLETFRRLEQCIKKIESVGPEQPAAAARLLAARQAPDAIGVLLDYLPHADDDWVEEEVLASLGRLMVNAGKVDPLLLAALKDSSPERRGTAVYILGRRGDKEQRATLRRFLADPSPEVQLRAAQGMLGKRIFQSLAETAPADEAFLKSNHIGADEPDILTFLQKRTLGERDQKRLEQLIRQLGAGSFYARAEASKKLIEQGTPALTFLKKAAQDPDLEISRRALRCIEEIQRGPGSALPTSAVRLLARPGQTSAANSLRILLAYVPFADDDQVQEEVLSSLCLLSLRQEKLDPLIPAALQDALPARRAAAAYVLGKVGTSAHCQAIRKLLDDPAPLVRLRAAQGLLAAQDKSAVPSLIALLAENNASLSWRVQEILHGLAGDGAPADTSEASPETRQKAVKAWQQWWHAQASNIDLGAAGEGQFHRGLITICEYDSAVGRPGGQVFECGRDSRTRWKIADLLGPMDAQVLANGRVLVAENSARRVTERDFAGSIRWSHDLQGNPITRQRLPNGNTFIATYNQVLEVTPAHQVVYTHAPGPNFYIFSARKLLNGRIVCITAQGKIIEIEAMSGKEMRTVNAGPNGGWASVEVLPSGRYLVATMANGQVREIDAAGTTHWNAIYPGAFRATRLPNGHTLVASMTTRKVAELDRTGHIRWERACDGRPWSVRFR